MENRPKLNRKFDRLWQASTKYKEPKPLLSTANGKIGIAATG